MNDVYKKNKFVLIALFLAVEIMLFIALDFGGGGLIYKGAAIIIAICLAPFLWKEMNVDLGKGLYVLLMPLILYGFVTVLSPAYGSPLAFFDTEYFNPARETFMNLSLLSRLLNLFGLIAILILGYILRKTQVIAVKNIYTIILVGLSVPLLISLIATLSNYGFFHALIYKGQVNFYGGQAYLVSEQASMLLGFEIVTVKLDVVVTSALIISSVGLGLIFLKKDVNKQEFILLASMSGLGLVTILFTGSFLSLIFLLPSVLFVLIIKFNLKKYITKKVIYGVIGLVILGGVVFILSAFNIFNLQVIWQQNPITRKLLYNGYIRRFYAVFVEAFTFSNIYGTFSNVFMDTVSGTLLNAFPTGNFLFDAMWIDGLFGFITLFAFIVIFVKNLVKYFKESADEKGLKVGFISLLITAFSRYMFFTPFNQFVYREYAEINFFPLVQSPIFLVTIFMAGYTFVSTIKKEEVVNEDTK